MAENWDVQTLLRRRVLEAIEQVLEEELTEALGTGRYERQEARRDEDAGLVFNRGGGGDVAVRAGGLRPDPAEEDRRSPPRVGASHSCCGDGGVSIVQEITIYAASFDAFVCDQDPSAAARLRKCAK